MLGPRTLRLSARRTIGERGGGGGSRWNSNEAARGDMLVRGLEGREGKLLSEGTLRLGEAGVIFGERGVNIPSVVSRRRAPKRERSREVRGKVFTGEKGVVGVPRSPVDP
jgi:hypothetical protein